MKFHATIRRWTLAMLVALVALAATAGSALAAPPAPKDPAANNARLAQAFRHQQQRLAGQAERLKRADEFAGKVEALIAKAKGNGKDTAKLEQALATFRAALGEARAEWQAAADVLKTHAGFGDDGKVTDAEAARATVKAAHDHMQAAHDKAKGGFKALREALKAFRQANRAQQTPTVPQEP